MSVTPTAPRTNSNILYVIFLLALVFICVFCSLSSSAIAYYYRPKETFEPSPNYNSPLINLKEIKTRLEDLFFG